MPTPTPRAEKVAVLGGGIAGLTAAHELAKAGHKVVLIEASEQLGGLGTYFDWNGHAVDKFYHCTMPTDHDLHQLIDEVGMTGELYWKPTRMGFVVKGQRFSFNGALDLLKFSPLNLFERIRFGAVSLFLRRLGMGKDLDNLRIEDWLVSIYGKSIWHKLLRPLFQSKFGPAAGGMPALYIWERLGREKNTAKRGYVKGGLKALIDAVEAKLKLMGVEIHTGASVESINEIKNYGVEIKLDHGRKLDADWCVSTLPLPLLRTAIKGAWLEDKIRIPEVRYQGVVNAMFFLKKPLDNFYWAPVVDSGTEFDGIVEITELIDTEHFGGHHVVYVMKYCDRDSALFAEPAAEIGERWTGQLLALYPDLDLTAEDVADVRVFKAPFVEPAYPLGYSTLKPEVNEGGTRVFLSTSSQVYPRITAWNSSVGLAKDVVKQLLARIGVESAAKPASAEGKLAA